MDLEKTWGDGGVEVPPQDTTKMGSTSCLRVGRLT